MIRNIFFLTLILFSTSYSMDLEHEVDDENAFETKVKCEEEKVNFEENVICEDQIIEKQPDLTKKFVKNDFENFIFLAKVLNRKKVPTVIRNQILNFIYLPYPSKLRKIYRGLNLQGFSDTSSIYSLYQFNKKFLIAGHSNGLIAVWDLQKNKRVKLFNANQGSIINLIKMKDNIFISLSKSRLNPDQEVQRAIIKVWNINSAACLNTIKIDMALTRLHEPLEGYATWEFSRADVIKISYELFAFGISSGFNVYSIYTGVINEELPEAEVNKIINMFNLDMPSWHDNTFYQKIKELEKEEQSIIMNSIDMGNNIVLNVFGRSGDQKIKIFNKNSQVYERIYEDTKSHFFMKINNFIFVSKEHNGKIRIWDIRKKDFIFEVNNESFFIGTREQNGKLIKINDDSIAISNRLNNNCWSQITIYGPSLDIKQEPNPEPECCTIL